MKEHFECETAGSITDVQSRLMPVTKYVQVLLIVNELRKFGSSCDASQSE